MRISLHPGVWIGTVGLWIMGGIAMTQSGLPTQIHTYRLGEMAIVLGLLLFIWGIKWDGKHWWKALLNRLAHGKRPKQLYLYPGPVGTEADPWKGYWASWSPTTDFGIGFSSRTAVQSALRRDGLSPEEIALVLYLFNAGPDDVRHLTITWQMPGFNVVEEVRREGLFGDCVSKLEQSYIELFCGDRASRRPFRNPEDVTIAVLKAHEQVIVQSPMAFTYAFAVACLVLAKRAGSQEPLPAEKMLEMNPFELIDMNEKPMPPVVINVSYTVPDGAVLKQSFELHGRATVSILVRKKEGEGLAFENVPDSLCTGIRNLQVIQR